jgi:hypothetical protein
MADYKKFLLALLAYGPKLPEAAAIIQDAVGCFRHAAEQLAALFGGEPPLLGHEAPAFEVDADAEALEAKVESMMEGSEEAPKGRIRDLFTFLVESGLLEIVLALLLKSK